MRSLGILILAVSLILIAMERLNLIITFGVVGLLIGLFMVMFPEKAEELVTKFKSDKPV